MSPLTLPSRLLVRRHLVGRPCAARPHRAPCGLGAVTSAAPHALLRRTLLAQPPAQTSRTPDRGRSHRHGKAGGEPARKSKYIPWAELLHRTFGFEIVSAKCQALLRLIALVKNQDVAKKILTAMHLPTEVPELHPARPPPPAEREARDAEDWLN